MPCENQGMESCQVLWVYLLFDTYVLEKAGNLMKKRNLTLFIHQNPSKIHNLQGENMNLPVCSTSSQLRGHSTFLPEVEDLEPLTSPVWRLNKISTVRGQRFLFSLHPGWPKKHEDFIRLMVYYPISVWPCRLETVSPACNTLPYHSNGSLAFNANLREDHLIESSLLVTSLSPYFHPLPNS